MDTYEYLVKEEISPMSGYRLNEYGDDGWDAAGNVFVQYFGWYDDDRTIVPLYV